jgi:S1-C subfamily serine protease
MARVLAAALILAAFARAGDDDLEKARQRVRGLESDIQALIDDVSPAVGAVMNYGARFDPKTGKMVMQPRSMGSGTIVDPRGFFLTNVHVIAGAGYLTVALNDGKRYPAALYADTSKGQVKGDIALLKLRGKKRFPHVSWTDGDATKLEPGSFVFAMGNPHGHALDGTPVVTLGIISGKGRAAAEAGYLYIDSVQTDAEINPGNSGGPLFDARGRFVGINGLMQSRQGRSNSGIGFAIPVNQVRLFMRKLLKDEGGGVGYGFHGLTLQSVPTGGAMVTRIVNASPAAKAGLRKGDIVRKVNGKLVKNRTDFVNNVGKLPAGKSVRRQAAGRQVGRGFLPARPRQQDGEVPLGGFFRVPGGVRAESRFQSPPSAPRAGVPRGRVEGADRVGGRNHEGAARVSRRGRRARGWGHHRGDRRGADAVSRLDREAVGAQRTRRARQGEGAARQTHAHFPGHAL